MGAWKRPATDSTELTFNVYPSMSQPSVTDSAREEIAALVDDWPRRVARRSARSRWPSRRTS